MDPIVLKSGPCRLVATTDGGGLLELSFGEGATRRHILRPASPAPSGPLDRALIPMAPWCNRIGGGGFHFGGRFHALAPNLPPFPLPLHGNAFQARWQVLGRRPDRLRLGLSSDGPAPFRYRAELTYALAEASLAVELAVTNAGDEPLPFAIGLHPWFTATADTRLQFRATRQFATDASGLPVAGPVAEIAPEHDFSRPAPLPAGRIDNTFRGWDGLAVLHHPDATVELRSDAQYLHVFSPDLHAGFCCLEPQTAPPNAVNHRGATVLGVGERLATDMAIVVRT